MNKEDLQMFQENPFVAGFVAGFAAGRYPRSFTEAELQSALAAFSEQIKESSPESYKIFFPFESND